MKSFGVVLICALVFTGCGQTNWSIDSDVPIEVEAAVGSRSCSERAILAVQFGGTMAEEDIPEAGLTFGDWLEDVQPGKLGVDPLQWMRIRSQVVEHVANVFGPFEIDVMDAGNLSGLDEPIATVHVVWSESVVEHCQCQGITPRLGAPGSPTSNAYVFANAFVRNGLVGALQRADRDVPDGLSIAIANTVAHEAGHTLGLVHVDPQNSHGAVMARNSHAKSRITLDDATTLQFFSDQSLPTADDAKNIKPDQCDACVIRNALLSRCDQEAY